MRWQSDSGYQSQFIRRYLIFYQERKSPPISNPNLQPLPDVSIPIANNSQRFKRCIGKEIGRHLWADMKVELKRRPSLLYICMDIKPWTVEYWVTNHQQYDSEAGQDTQTSGPSTERRVKTYGVRVYQIRKWRVDPGGVLTEEVFGETAGAAAEAWRNINSGDQL